VQNSSNSLIKMLYSLYQKSNIMKRLLLSLLCLFIFSNFAFCQSEAEYDSSTLPYESIGEYPISHSAGNMIKRIIDGLGYRYYWATDSLTIEDLNFKPGETNRTSLETLDHLHGLSDFILKAARGLPNERGVDKPEYEWIEKRKLTLENFKEAASIFSLMTEDQLSKSEIKFRRGNNESSVPFWHIINGPIADALNHVGQIISNRRASGNPLDPRVNVFMGNNR